MTHLEGGAHEASASNLNSDVTGVDRRTLDGIFRHPLSHNLSWRDVVTLVTAIGSVEEKRNGEFVFKAGHESLALKRPHDKDLTGPDVMDVRHFLTRAGWSPAASEASPADADAPSPGLIVVIDHAGAKVYHVDRSADAKQAAAAYDPQTLLHHIVRKVHDADRDETYPDDERYFEAIAAAVASGGEIVVIGHGKGQSNEADHLSAYLKTHHHGAYVRIVKAIVADLPHLTTPELLQLGRHAFG